MMPSSYNQTTLTTAPPIRQSGAALLAAMMIFALAAAAAGYLVHKTHISVTRTEYLRDADQARLYAHAGEQWVAQILARDNAALDSYLDDWAQPLPPFPIDRGYIAGTVTDLDGRFNLNNLVDMNTDRLKESETIFRRLLDTLDLPHTLMLSLQDWIDSDDNARFPDGAEDNDYLGLTPAYRTANQALVSLDELGLIKGFDQPAITALLPYVYTAPILRPININTASPVVLQALVSDLSLSDAQELVDTAQNTPFNTVNDFKADSRLAGKTVPTLMSGVTSEYFLLNTEVNIGTVTVRQRTWIHRGANATLSLYKRSRQN